MRVINTSSNTFHLESSNTLNLEVDIVINTSINTLMLVLVLGDPPHAWRGRLLRVGGAGRGLGPPAGLYVYIYIYYIYIYIIDIYIYIYIYYIHIYIYIYTYVVLQDVDDGVAPFALPFGFPFYGEVCNNIK